MDNIHISVVIPVYGCPECLVSLCQRLRQALSHITDRYEIILVNDSSPDNSWEIIQEIAQTESVVKGINLSRNFGQHCAISAGLEYATGDWIIVMDCDLQDQPEEIAKLYAKANEGFDQVVAIREKRKDNFVIRMTSKLFYLIFNYLADEKLDNRVANFGIYSRKVIDSIKRYKEKDRSFGLLAHLVGFKRAAIKVEHGLRPKGQSSYNFSKRTGLAISHVLSHSNKPLLLVVKIGFTCSFLASLYIVWLLIKFFFMSSTISGWPSVMVSLFFLSGFIISVVGMVGIYVGRIYSETKDRPLYIVDETTFPDKG